MVASLIELSAVCGRWGHLCGITIDGEVAYGAIRRRIEEHSLHLATLLEVQGG